MKPLPSISLCVLLSAMLYFPPSEASAAPRIEEARTAILRTAGQIVEPIEVQYRPGMPLRPSASKPTTVRYSRSATAGNMVTPAILLGMPIMFILALIIMAMKGD